MDVTMINDCSYTGETIIKFASGRVNYTHLKRTRGIYAKSLGLLGQILRSRADLYHVHYGLQDHFLTKLFKRNPTICHLHGGEMRTAIHSIYNPILKFNLITADEVIVPVPDIYEQVLSYRGDAVYIPDPVDVSLFTPTKYMRSDDPLVVLLPSSLNSVKGVDRFLVPFSRLQKAHENDFELWVSKHGSDRLEVFALLNKLGIKYYTIPYVQRDIMPLIYRGVDVVVPDMKLGCLVMSSLESMACGVPVLQYIESDHYDLVDEPNPPVYSIQDPCDFDEMSNSIEALHDPDVRAKISKRQSDYVSKFHDPRRVACCFEEMYMEVLKHG